MKLIDFDGLFDEKLTQYMKESGKKRSPKQWEDAIPKLYKQFGDTYIAKIKCTPKQYYAKMTEEALAETLAAHLEQDISVPEFLTNELESRGAVETLLPLLGQGGKAAEYALNLIGDDARAFDTYFSILIDENGDEGLKGEIVDMFRQHADEVKARVIEAYQKGIEKGYMLEILSRVTLGEDAIYQILLEAFQNADEKELPLCAGYLAAYGDERALPHLYRKIEDKSIGFVEFQELKYAIEALGGEYDEERDFTADKDYLRVQSAKEKGTDNNETNI
jgi:hypothetical protein